MQDAQDDARSNGQDWRVVASTRMLSYRGALRGLRHELRRQELVAATRAAESSSALAATGAAGAAAGNPAPSQPPLTTQPAQTDGPSGSGDPLASASSGASAASPSASSPSGGIPPSDVGGAGQSSVSPTTDGSTPPVSTQDVGTQFVPTSTTQPPPSVSGDTRSAAVTSQAARHVRFDENISLIDSSAAIPATVAETPVGGGGNAGTHGPSTEKGHRRSLSQTFTDEAVSGILGTPAFLTSSPLQSMDLTPTADVTLSTPLGTSVLRPPGPPPTGPPAWGFGQTDGVLRHTALGRATGRVPVSANSPSSPFAVFGAAPPVSSSGASAAQPAGPGLSATTGMCDFLLYSLLCW